MIPVASTTITVHPSPRGGYDEPYEDPVPGTPLATGVRAVIDIPTGREEVSGGSQTELILRLVADLCPVTRLCSVTDELTGTTYEVTWVHVHADDSVGLAHVEARLRLVEGLT